MSLLEPDDAIDGGAPNDDATDLGNEDERPQDTDEPDSLTGTLSPPD